MEWRGGNGERRSSRFSAGSPPTSRECYLGQHRSYGLSITVLSSAADCCRTSHLELADDLSPLVRDPRDFRLKLRPSIEQPFLDSLHPRSYRGRWPPPPPSPSPPIPVATAAWLPPPPARPLPRCSTLPSAAFGVHVLAVPVRVTSEEVIIYQM